jgi:hypothetical protein
MNGIHRALTAFCFAASFMVFGVAHAQVSESSGIPFFEHQFTTEYTQMLFSQVPANTLRVIKMVNCSATLDTGDLVSVTLADQSLGVLVALEAIDLPWVPTVPLDRGLHTVSSINSVLFYIPSGTQPVILVTNAKGHGLQSASCQLTGYDVPSPGLKVGGTTD